MKKVLCVFALCFVLPVYTHAQSFNIPEGYFYIDLGDGDWQKDEGTPNGIIKQYDFTSDYSRYISIRIMENEGTKQLIDMSAVKKNDKTMDDFVNAALKSLGNSKLLNKGWEDLGNFNTIYMEWVRYDDPAVNVPIYCRDFSTIKNGRAIHFVFMYLDENAFKNGRQQDIDTLKTVAFTKDTSPKTQTTETSGSQKDIGNDISYSIGKVIGVSLILCPLLWIVFKLFRKNKQH